MNDKKKQGYKKPIKNISKTNLKKTVKEAIRDLAKNKFKTIKSRSKLASNSKKFQNRKSLIFKADLRSNFSKNKEDKLCFDEFMAKLKSRDSLFSKSLGDLSVGISTLLKVKAHLGHTEICSHPNIKGFLYGAVNDTSIIDLRKTWWYLTRAIRVVHDVASEEGKIFFFTDREEYFSILQKTADSCDSSPYHKGEWKPGLISNWETHSSYLNRFVHILNKRSRSIIYKKKKIKRLYKNYEGLAGRVRALPDLFIFLNGSATNIVREELSTSFIPSIGIVDTNNDPEKLTYPIPGNDDSIEFQILFCTLLRLAYNSGKNKEDSLDKDLLRKKIIFDYSKNLEAKKKTKDEARTHILKNWSRSKKRAFFEKNMTSIYKANKFLEREQISPTISNFEKIGSNFFQIRREKYLNKEIIGNLEKFAQQNKFQENSNWGSSLLTRLINQDLLWKLEEGFLEKKAIPKFEKNIRLLKEKAIRMTKKINKKEHKISKTREKALVKEKKRLKALKTAKLNNSELKNKKEERKAYFHKRTDTTNPPKSQIQPSKKDSQSPIRISKRKGDIKGITGRQHKDNTSATLTQKYLKNKKRK